MNETKTKSTVTQRCGKCRFYSPAAGGICDYLCIHIEEQKAPPHRRGCPAGDDCDKFEAKAGQAHRVRIRQLPWKDRAELMMEGYRQGLRDSQIAKMAKVNLYDVQHWRRMNNLPPTEAEMNKHKTRLKRGINYEKLQALYEQGMHDAAIAEALSCSHQAVAKWRHDRNLKPNKSPLPPQMRKRLDYNRARFLYGQGMSDKQIAREVGCQMSTIQRWRMREELPAVGKKRFDRAEAKRLYEKGLSDGEIAKKLGASIKTVQEWRRASKLPQHGSKERREEQERMDRTALEMYQAGFQAGDIAKAVGRSTAWVNRWKQKRGLPIEKRKQKNKTRSATDADT